MTIKVEDLLEQHTQQRLAAINLIVSENRMSTRAMAPLGSDLQNRYAAPFYAGTGPAREVIDLASDLATRVFGARYANLSPISGNVALLAVVFALSKPRESVGRVPPFFPGGGYPINYEVFDRRPLPLPFSESDWQLDLPRTVELLNERRPPLVILGSSIVTYPMPVREVARVVHDYGGIVAYDGSHSLGLIAGGQYQDPLREGADILFGSTHKTFPGPQGGLILTNSEQLHRRIELLANFTPLNGPTLICNPHLARLASTAVVLEDTPWREYAAQVVANARTVAATLRDAGVPMHGVKAKNFPELTYCHQVVTNYPKHESARLRDRLQARRINVDGFLRIGVSEITRLGFKAAECREIADIVAHLLLHEGDDGIPDIDRRIGRLIERHCTVVL